MCSTQNLSAFIGIFFFKMVLINNYSSAGSFLWEGSRRSSLGLKIMGRYTNNDCMRYPSISVEIFHN